MARLPTGTVTFLFTDIEGSTRLLQQLGDRYVEVLTRQRGLLRATFAEHGGGEVDVQGDALFFAFPRARDAVAAAVAGQRAILIHHWPDEISLRIRMGVHTGEPVAAEGGYAGLDIHRAARIAHVAHGAQILISQTTHDLVAEDLPDHIALRDLGAHRLKDLARAHHLYQVIAADLPTDFPPLKSLDVFPNNLPHQWTSFVGRQQEIIDVKHLVEVHRLVTLTGIGGSGKTRLALQVGAELLASFPDGVWLAELAVLTDQTLIPQTVATALGIREMPKRSMLATLVDALKPRRMLLVLDNCEHLLDGCAALADTLLKECPDLRILASSREAIGITGEATYRVPSLSTPDLRGPRPGNLLDYDSVQLFVDRAAAASPGFALKEQNATAIATICRRLDGIALAIEMAAPRVKTMTLEKLSERLQDRFRLLRGGSRTALSRQQTLQATMDWSYDLLSPQEQAVLRRLAAFAGGFTPEAAEAVCAGVGVEAVDVPDLLTRLVEKSLVLFQEGEGRYSLLETVRQYGRDRLLEAGEADAARTRHRDFFLALAEDAERQAVGPVEIPWLNRLEIEHDNLRAALASSFERRDTVEGARLAGALSYFWLAHSHWNEGLRWLERAAAEATDASAAVRARVLFGAGLMALNVGPLDLADTRFQESIALGQESGDHMIVTRSLNNLGLTALYLGDIDRAKLLLEEGLALAREHGYEVHAAAALTFLATVVSYDDFDRSVAMREESVALARQLNSKWGLRLALVALGRAAQITGDYQRAAELFSESSALSQELGDTIGAAWSAARLAGIASIQGDHKQAKMLLERSLGLFRQAGAPLDSLVLEGLGALAMHEADFERATQLFTEGLAEARRAGDKLDIASFLYRLSIAALHQGDHQRAEALVEESLGLFREVRWRLGVANCLSLLASRARDKGDSARAADLCRESLRLRREYRNRLGIARSLEGLAGLAAASGRPGRAARLFGAAEEIREAIGAPLSPLERPTYTRDVEAVDASLTPEAQKIARAKGRALTLKQAIEYALEESGLNSSNGQGES